MPQAKENAAQPLAPAHIAQRHRGKARASPPGLHSQRPPRSGLMGASNPAVYVQSPDQQAMVVSISEANR